MINHLEQNCEYLHHLQDGQCFHDDLFPLTLYNSLGYLLIIIILGLSTVGGLGGGIEKIPILIVMLNFSQSKATLYVYVLTFGTNLVNFLMLIYQKHPLADKQIIDYELSLILLPTALFGSAFGNILHQILPDIFLISILIVFFSIFVPKLYIKAKQNREQEMQVDNKQKTVINQEVTHLIAEQYKSEDQQIIPLYKFLLLLIIFMIVQCVLMIRGGKKQQSFIGIQYCSDGKLINNNQAVYWITTGMIIVVLLLISYGIKYHLGRETKTKIEIGYFNEKVDFNFIESKFFMIVWISGFLGGIMGGMTGVGAGAIIVSILILQNVNSRVASATGGFQKLFISLFTTILSYQQGDLNKNEILFFFILGLLSGLLIAGPMYYYLELNPKQNYLVIYLVCIFLVISAISGAIYIFKEIVIMDRWNKMIQTHTFC
ncbi:unnamed protein product (macronuclear) [Paramecium tetraurelia]|uniref:Sulfite exporter TauE/SafE n=1 Tax=Paramecium tetraurelia TaxID=5888 RepID=A0DLX3_PARTE|nr:uncharacterized protein GSPATT00018258001 [Paramecium tetraurelia]CAK84040.1 unnamed protein product [Paramecium tetraurelia]|eukprot:XP_001451437.1 hypothetical protein (macronuclear) [Paramecium tetraurelia strain d4-2]